NCTEPRFSSMAAVATLVVLGTLVLLPPVLAAAAGSSLGNMHPWAPGKYAMPPFCGARPVTSSELIAAKLRFAVRITLFTGSLVLVTILILLPFSFVGRTLADWARLF